MKRKLLCLLGAILLWGSVRGQALYGTSGLLHLPTANMEKDKTFMFGGNYLDTHPLSTYFQSKDVGYTLNYYLNMTFFPWLEIAYTCTLKHSDYGSSWPEKTWGKFSNQDRMFSIKLRLWKEGWWKEWTPQVVSGSNDPGTHNSYGGGNIGLGNDSGSSNWFSRFYLVATKHFGSEGIGTLGVHVAYIIGNAQGIPHYKKLGAGVDFRLSLPADEIFMYKVLNGLSLMAEYDARTANIGAEYSFWKDYINVVVEFNRCRYFSGGLIFKVHLK